MKSKDNSSKKKFDKAAIARKYYDILDVYTNNILVEVAGKSAESLISKESLKHIHDICLAQKLKAREWGFDQIIKTIQD